MEETGYLPSEMIAELKAQKAEAMIGSSVSFLQEHSGWERGCIHLLIGTTSGGKSTLVRTLLLDFVANNPGLKALVVLSEEEHSDLLLSLANSVGDEMPFMKRVFIYEELNTKAKNYEENLTEIENSVKRNNVDLVIYDNLTTSKFYCSLNPSGQSGYGNRLKSITKGSSVSMLLVAHTRAGINDNSNYLIDIQDIRGNKNTVNLAEYAYVLQRFQVNNEYHPFLILKKYRGHAPQNIFFMLHYDRKKRAYTDFSAVDFEEFKKIFKLRNKL